LLRLGSSTKHAKSYPVSTIYIYLGIS